MNRITQAGLVLGLGLGGLADGIVFHQILGWHHLICTTETCQVATVEALSRQNTQDGWFHAVMWLVVVVGLTMLSRAERDRTTARLSGGILAGWGIFNFSEGLIDHQILGIHHVRPGHPQQLWFDLLFLASGVVMAAVGAILVRAGTQREKQLRG